MNQKERVLNAISAVSLPVFIAIIVAVALFKVDQLSDLVLEANDSWSKSLWYGFCALYFNLMIWWTCRQILDYSTFYNEIESKPDGRKSRFPFFTYTSPSEEQQRLNEHRIPSGYYGGKFGFYIPRVLPGLFFLIVVVFASIYSAWRIAFLSIAAFTVMYILLKSRRDYLYRLHSQKLKSRQTWNLLLITLFLAFTAMAIFSPESIYGIGGLGITLMGLGGLVVGSTLVVYGFIFPLVNSVFKEGHFLHTLPPYPVSLTMLAIAIFMSIVFQTDNHAYRTCDGELCSTASRPYKSIEEAFDTFTLNKSLSYHTSGDKKIVPVYFIANQGGGHYIIGIIWLALILFEESAITE